MIGNGVPIASEGPAKTSTRTRAEGNVAMTYDFANGGGENTNGDPDDVSEGESTGSIPGDSPSQHMFAMGFHHQSDMGRGNFEIIPYFIITDSCCPMIISFKGHGLRAAHLTDGSVTASQVLTAAIDTVVCSYEFVDANGREVRGFAEQCNEYVCDPYKQQPNRPTSMLLRYLGVRPTTVRERPD